MVTPQCRDGLGAACVGYSLNIEDQIRFFNTLRPGRRYVLLHCAAGGNCRDQLAQCTPYIYTNCDVHLKMRLPSK